MLPSWYWPTMPEVKTTLAGPLVCPTWANGPVLGTAVGLRVLAAGFDSGMVKGTVTRTDLGRVVYVRKVTTLVYVGELFILRVTEYSGECLERDNRRVHDGSIDPL